MSFVPTPITCQTMRRNAERNRYNGTHTANSDNDDEES